MTESYKTLLKQGEAEVVEKKSRFIACARPVENEDEALEFIASVKKRHYGARHNAYAYVTGIDTETVRQSDDGEPSGTAGMPALGVIRAEGLKNVVIVITRYFGGTLLGTGGLVRAYGRAAAEAVRVAGVTELKLYGKFKVTASYPLLGKLQYEFERAGYKITEIMYGENIEIISLAVTAKSLDFLELIRDLSGGSAKALLLERIYA